MTSPVIPRPVGPTIGGVGVVDDDGVLAAQADAGPSVPGELHAPILAQGTCPAITARDRPSERPGIERTGSACPIGASGPREGGWNLLRCSESNHRPPPIQRRDTERLRNAHLDPAAGRPNGARDHLMAECRAMTSNPHRAATRRLAVLAALLTLVAACGQASPSASPAPASSTAAPSTPAPTASPSAPPSVAPSSSAAARVSCADTVESPAPSSAPQEQASPDANDPNAATYSEIESQVTAIRGLTLNSPVQRATFDRAGARRSSSRRPSTVTTRRRSSTATSACSRRLALMPAGRLAPRPLRRDAHEPGRRPVRRRRPRRCTWSPRRARSGRPRRSRTPTSTRTRSRTRRSTSARSRARRPTRATGRSPGRR